MCDDAAAYVARLRACEAAAWSSAQARQLYSTPLISGYPYYTVPLAPDRNDADAHGALCAVCRRALAAARARRHVVPYDYTFRVFVKGRWVERRLLSVYSSELPHHTRAYYAACLRAGRLRCVSRAAQHAHCVAHGVSAVRRRDVKRQHAHDVLAAHSEATQQQQQQQQCEATTSNNNDNNSSSNDDGDVVLQCGDLVLHTVHRHEVPVLVGGSGVAAVRVLAVRIAACGVLSVYKPAGVVTHATGRFYYNSLLGMLEYVLARRRLHAWLYEHDTLLQGLVDTSALCSAEVDELYAYYNKDTHTHDNSSDTDNNNNNNNDDDDRVVCMTRAPRACYRLDRVTSGVLLLGVSREATRCVSAAVMRKTHRVTAALHNTLHDDDDNNNSNSNDATTTQLCEAVCGVRKRYLARVHGCFPRSQAAAATATTTTLTSLLARSAAAATASLDVRVCWRDAHTLLVLTRHTTTTTRVRNKDDDDDAADADGGGDGDGGGGAGVSATLVQRLPCAHDADKDTHAASCVQSTVVCTPLTGRMHQIRIHLASIGYGIVGDSVYATHAADNNDVVNTSNVTATATTPTAAAAAAARTHKRHRHDDTNSNSNSSSSHNDNAARCASCVYHCEDELPATYAAYMRTRATAPVPHDKSNNDKGDGEEGEEPLCYECAHKLHVAMLCEAHAPSRICLHAHEYSLDAALLLLPGTRQGVQHKSTKGSDNASDNTNADKDDDARVRALLRALQPSTAYVRVDEARRCVTFASPPPSWLHSDTSPVTSSISDAVMLLEEALTAADCPICLQSLGEGHSSGSSADTAAHTQQQQQQQLHTALSTAATDRDGVSRALQQHIASAIAASPPPSSSSSMFDIHYAPGVRTQWLRCYPHDNNNDTDNMHGSAGAGNVAVLLCGHLLHYTCALQLYEYSNSATCPVCRAPVDSVADVIAFAPRTHCTAREEQQRQQQRGNDECKARHIHKRTRDDDDDDDSSSSDSSQRDRHAAHARHDSDKRRGQEQQRQQHSADDDDDEDDVLLLPSRHVSPSRMYCARLLRLSRQYRVRAANLCSREAHLQRSLAHLDADCRDLRAAVHSVQHISSSSPSSSSRQQNNNSGSGGCGGGIVAEGDGDVSLGCGSGSDRRRRQLCERCTAARRACDAVTTQLAAATREGNELRRLTDRYTRRLAAAEAAPHDVPA